MVGLVRAFGIVLLVPGIVGLLVACEEEKKNPPPVGSSSGVGWGGSWGGGSADGDGEDTGGGSSSGGGGSGEGGCAEACDVLLGCDEFYASLEACLADCQAAYDYAVSVGVDCEDSMVSYNLCLGRLTCDELDAFLNYDPPDAYPCKAEVDAVDADCAP